MRQHRINHSAARQPIAVSRQSRALANAFSDPESQSRPLLIFFMNVETGNFVPDSEKIATDTGIIANDFNQPELLTGEQKELADELREILDQRSKDMVKMPYDTFVQELDKVTNFANENPDLRKYIFFHMLIGSGLDWRGLETDTQDHKIEKFIRSLRSLHPNSSGEKIH